MFRDLDADSYSIKGGSGIGLLELPPAGRGAAALQEMLTARGGEFIDGLAHRGAVLIRGSGAASVGEFESLWRDPFVPWNGYRFMERSREKKGEVAVSSNYKTGDYGVLTFHQENHSLPLSLSPDWLAFFCQHPAEVGGETGLINVANAFAALPAALQAKLRAHATKSAHRISAAEWCRQFGGSFEPEQVQAEARRHGVTVRKLDQASVHVEYERPYVLTHRLSGVPAVHFERKYVPLDNDAARRYLGAFRPHHTTAIELPGPLGSLRNWLLSKRNVLLARLLRGVKVSALKLTRAEVKALATAWGDHAIAVPYRKGDILVIDNTLIEHTALAWKGEREISVVMGTYALS